MSTWLLMVTLLYADNTTETYYTQDVYYSAVKCEEHIDFLQDTLSELERLPSIAKETWECEKQTSEDYQL